MNILLVEDSEGDVILIRKAMEKAGLCNELTVVDDGEKALQYLRDQAACENASLPDLVLLDINLPRINGKEVLEQIRMHERLKEIPVVILTTSDNEQDRLEAYQKKANSYITKPANFDNFLTVVRTIESFGASRYEKP